MASRKGAIPASPNSRRAQRWVTSTATPSSTNRSSSSVAHLIDMPIALANVVADISGVAANTSTAMATREVLRRLENPSAIDDAQRVIHARAQPL